MYMRILSAIILLFAVCEPSIGAEIALTPTQSSACKQLAAGHEYSDWRCPGAAGYYVKLATADSVFAISFTLNKSGKIDNQGDLNWLWTGSGIGDRIEWRLVNGYPYAAIFEIWRNDFENAAVVRELVVAKVLPSGSCRIATVNSRLEHAAKLAREIADTVASTFKCGHDKELVKSAPESKQVRTSKNDLAPHEVLDHGGSLMDLTRADDGQIEIRYREPRAGLSVSLGTLLFKGTADKAGKVIGVAYTFKPGCSPAPYRVEGEWDDGVLTLSGAAPKRARSACEVVGYDASSRNANLIFGLDILLSDAGD